MKVMRSPREAWRKIRALPTNQQWWILIALIVVLAAIGKVAEYVDPKHFDHDSIEYRSGKADARRDFASTVGAGVSTEGDADEGLVLNISACPANVDRVLGAGNITDRLDQLDFQWVRCKESRIKIVRPWR